MSEAATKTRLWTPQGFREDEWIHAETVDNGPRDGQIILPLAVWLETGEATRRSGRIAVELQPGDPLDAVVEQLDSLPLVALAFPVFSDGRSYSKAELLRARHGYLGQIRATGDMLIDQVSHMLRVGFDALEVRHETTILRLEAGETGDLGRYYQPAASEALKTNGYSWRRQPAT